VHLITDQLY